MELSTKIAEIKEKITLLASKMENLRSQKLMLVKENKELKIKLQRDEEEIKILKHQVAVLTERINTQLQKEIIEEEEEDIDL